MSAVALDLAERLSILAARKGWRCLRALPRWHVLALVRSADPELFRELAQAGEETQNEVRRLVSSAEAATLSLSLTLLPNNDEEEDGR